jgi:hypothetical protein
VHSLKHYAFKADLFLEEIFWLTSSRMAMPPDMRNLLARMHGYYNAWIPIMEVDLD